MNSLKSKHQRQFALNFIAPLSLEECQERLGWLRERSHSIFSSNEWYVKVDIRPVDQQFIKFRILKYIRFSITQIGDTPLYMNGYLKAWNDTLTQVAVYRKAYYSIWLLNLLILIWIVLPPIVIIFPNDNLSSATVPFLKLIGLTGGMGAIGLLFVEWARRIYRHHEKELLTKIAYTLRQDSARSFDEPAPLKPKKQFRNLDEDDY